MRKDRLTLVDGWERLDTTAGKFYTGGLTTISAFGSFFGYLAFINDVISKCTTKPRDNL